MFCRMRSSNWLREVSSNSGVLPDLIHLRNFRPDHNARLVTKAVKIIAVLVVRATNHRAAHFLDKRDLLVQIRLGNRPALVETVLMLVHAVQMIRLAVQKKSFVGVNR